MVSVVEEVYFSFYFFQSFSGAEQQIVDDFLRRHGEITLTNSVLVQASGKLVLIDKLLPKLRANGHKVNKQTTATEIRNLYIYIYQYM